MKRNIILGGLSVALFAAGLIFFANSGANNAVATEPVVTPVAERPAACQRLIQEGSCGCTASGGTCNCGQTGGTGCAAASANNDGTAVTEKKVSCGCQQQAQQQ